MKAGHVLLYIIFTALTLSSCSGIEPVGIGFNTAETLLGPGLTAELSLSPLYPEDDGKQNRRYVSDVFSHTPEISTVDDSLKILSVKQLPTDGGPSCTIIIRAAETLLSAESLSLTASWAGYTARTLIKIRKQPALYINGKGVITDPAATDALINKNRRLPADYIPPDLVRVTVPTILSFEEVNHLRKPAADALSTMFAAAEAEEGYILCARSGYRSFRTQVSLFDSNVRAHGQEYADKFSAKPGTSEHQSGLAMDITAEVMNYQLEQTFGQTPEGRWTAENAHRFGFIIRYPEGKETVTGYAYEPWHLRYTGQALAAEIYNEDLTLEEYFSK